MSATIVSVEFRSPRTGMLEIVERTATRDEWFDGREGWGTRAQRPAGAGWQIVDFLSSEKLTRWERRIPRGRP
jgi:hypothetical protein